ncbi:toll/interleukin-1 receptor domain-containing protein [Aliarcobacter skirrowii]|uniref:Toll/interleukin-1 receptor domain-containing protein n=1 Tax=Aliarcobacter skirrowii TaxID=28200 RepID=A0AAW9DCE8_9BACT|nr:toll/interleukin-1 receptor domain-containing protein [Aliarcobacter skirrowii]MDX4069885.1 toll/interleukin-1 receptor domain-containing protein [Aliarcobacter skirrowii]
MKHWEKKANGWVFLSHSSKDYESVKLVRNYLEDNGFSALMFYLKCLEDKDKEDFVQNIIKWEIESRNIFVLCNSEEAKSSNWVREEFKYVKTLKNKIIKEIDMEIFKYRKATALSVLDTLINNATLYFIYHSENKEIVTKIYNFLNSKGFQILKNNPNTTSMTFKNKTNNFISAIEEAYKKGTILIFLSKKVLDSNWFWYEKERALSNKNKIFIIPIILDDVRIDEFPAFINSRYTLTLNYNFNEEDYLSKIENMINNVLKDKQNEA